MPITYPDPRVSVIVPLYNYEQYIDDCIESCLAQEYSNFEVIVVDDCSTDGSYGKVAAWKREDSRVKLLRTDENKGCSHARNVAIRESTGELITNIDADDMLTADSLAVRVRALVDNPDIDMVHAIAMRYRNGQTDGYNTRAKIHAQTVMMWKDVYKKFGLFYEKLRSKEDKELWYRLGIHPSSPLPKLIKTKQVKEVVAYYRKHPTQKHRLRKLDKAMNDLILGTFTKRIKQLQRDGITKENTEWLT